MSMRCRAVMCHALAPPHYRLLPRANSCLALFPNPTTQTTPCLLTVNIPLLHCLATMIPAPEIIVHTSGFSRGRDYLCRLSLFHRTSDSRPTFHPHPTRFPSLSPLACHHSPDALSIYLSFPNRSYPILATFLSMSCVLKRFSLTSPRTLALTCVKRPVLRTAGWTSLGRL